MKINNLDFSKLPLLSRKSSSWIQPKKNLTTFNTGDIVPFYAIDIMPGDNVKMLTNKLFTRMTTPIFPVMDNCYLDVYFFYVPYRILYDKFEEFLGAKKDGYGIQQDEFLLPNVYNITYTSHDIGAYLGIAQNTKISEKNAINNMRFRAYTKIYNEWFRDENLIQPYECKEVYENVDYENDSPNMSDISKLQYGIGIAKASKLHDLFTSALPFTQKGPNVVFNFDDDLNLQYDNDKFDSDIKLTTKSGNDDLGALRMKDTSGQGLAYNTPFALSPESKSPNVGVNVRKYEGNYSSFSSSPVGLSLNGLGVSPNISFSVNELRTAFQMQRFYEQLARSGTRYNEFIKGIFGVDILDSTIQRPELLSSKRFTINMNQVIQTSATDNVSPQGNTSGISATLINNDMCFNRSFTEHGVLMGLCVVRTNQTYVNRIPKEFSKLRKFDFYYPVFQSLGEQPILNKEIYLSGDDTKDNEVFGYQEAWYEYRYEVSYLSGKFADNGANSAYAPWTYANYVNETPILNKDFIQETENNVARTLAVQDDDQFICDCYCAPQLTRIMPLYSIPGMIDHF